MDVLGVYGTQGVGTSNTWPGGREGISAWITSTDMFIFGGYGYDSAALG